MSGQLGKGADSPDLVYGLEDRPPFGNALLSAVTHLLAIFVPMITPALIVGGALELPVEMTAYLVSMAMVASGVGTYLQVNRFGPVGSGMLSIQSVNFSFVTVMIALGAGMKEGGLTKDAMISTLLGVSFVGAFLVCFSAWLLPYLKKVITPTVSGVVVMLIGLSLVHVGITDFGGGFGAKADGTFGSMENLGLASLVLLIVLIFNCMKNPLLRMSGIAVGLIAGYIVALFLGKVDFSALQNLPLVTLPVPFKYGFAFDWHAFIVAGAIFLLSVFEAVGDLTATAMVSDQPIEGEEYTKRLRGGVLADGLVFGDCDGFGFAAADNVCAKQRRDSDDRRGFAPCGQIYCRDFGAVGSVPRCRSRVYDDSESGVGRRDGFDVRLDCDCGRADFGQPRHPQARSGNCSNVGRFGLGCRV